MLDAVLLYCFHYDAATGHYEIVITNVVRAGGVLTVLILGFAMIVMFRKERRLSTSHK